MKVGVVIPVYSQFELALGALQSVKTQHDWQPFIVDNWRNNRGVAAAWNEGINSAWDKNCDYVLVINDDVVLSQWTIDNQIKALELQESKDAGLVLTTGWATTPPDPSNPASMREYGDPPAEAAWVPGADFACFMINKICWETVGPFDQKFHPAYFEDNDYHRRILLSNLTARIVPQAPYYHYGSQTQKNSNVVQSEQFEKNKQYYHDKWGGLPGAEIYATPFNQILV